MNTYPEDCSVMRSNIRMVKSNYALRRLRRPTIYVAQSILGSALSVRQEIKCQLKFLSALKIHPKPETEHSENEVHEWVYTLAKGDTDAEEELPDTYADANLSDDPCKQEHGRYPALKFWRERLDRNAIGSVWPCVGLEGNRRHLMRLTGTFGERVTCHLDPPDVRRMARCGILSLTVEVSVASDPHFSV